MVLLLIQKNLVPNSCVNSWFCAYDVFPANYAQLIRVRNENFDICLFGHFEVRIDHCEVRHSTMRQVKTTKVSQFNMAAAVLLC